MDLFNIGNTGGLEILIILLLAFLLMGPGKVTQAARSLGKLRREVQKVTSRVTKAVSEIGEDEGIEEAVTETKKVGSEPNPGPA